MEFISSTCKKINEQSPNYNSIIQYLIDKKKALYLTKHIQMPIDLSIQFHTGIIPNVIIGATSVDENKNLSPVLSSIQTHHSIESKRAGWKPKGNNSYTFLLEGSSYLPSAKYSILFLFPIPDFEFSEIKISLDCELKE